MLGLVAAVCLVRWDGGTSPAEAESKGDASPRAPHAASEAVAANPSPVTRPSADEPVIDRRLVSGGFDAGSLDGGSLQDFVETVGKQAVLQWLAENATAAERHVDRYCAETKDLVKRKELSDPPRNHDAALYMAGRSDWEGGKIGLLHLPDSITQRMSNPPGAWRQAGPELYAGLDFTWMTELLQFDHWSLLGAGPLRDKEAANFYEEILPNYMPLMNWSKLRLIKGVHEGNLAQASVEVRHLADLIRSSGTLIGEMIRFAIYGLERKVWEDLGQPMPEGLPSTDEAWRLRHSAFAGMYFLYPGVPRAVREKALACIPTRCAALMEAIGAAASLRQLLPEAQLDLAWLQAQSPCDPELAARAARSPPITRDVITQNFMGGPAGIEPSMQSLTDGGL